MTKLRQFPVKVRQGIENYLKPNLVVGNILENGFEATFRTETSI